MSFIASVYWNEGNLVLNEGDFSSLKHCGVYRIKCLVNGFCYYGSASGRGFYNRFRTHYRDLQNGKHHSWILQKDWSRNGEKFFVFEVLETTTPSKTLELEQQYLDIYGTGEEKGSYNISPTAGSQLGIKRSDELKAFWSKQRKGRKVSESTKEKIRFMALQRSPELRNIGKSKEYIVIPPEGAEFKVVGLKQFCQSLNLCYPSMNRVALGKQQSHKGWKCRLPVENPPVFKAYVSSRAYIAISPDGQVYKFSNLRKFCREQGLNVSCLSKVANGAYRQYKGWSCQML